MHRISITIQKKHYTSMQCVSSLHFVLVILQSVGQPSHSTRKRHDLEDAPQISNDAPPSSNPSTSTSTSTCFIENTISLVATPVVVPIG